MNSQVKSSKDVSREIDRIETEDKALVLDEDDANASFEQSSGEALDNFIARAQNSREDIDGVLNDIFGKNDSKKMDSMKPSIKSITRKPSLPKSSVSMVKNITQQKTHPNRQELKTYTEKKLVYEVSDGTSGELDRIKAKLAERVAEITGLEVYLSSISGLKSNLETEVANLKRRNAQLEAEKIQLGSQLEARQLALEEANMAKKVAELDNQNKTRLLKERQELASRTYINSALENQRRVYEGEIETRNLRIEKLESNLKMAEDRLKLG